jgi:hypothetical protein
VHLGGGPCLECRRTALGDRHAKPDDEVELSRASWLASNAVVRRAKSR